MLMQNSGAQTKSIVVFSEVAHSYRLINWLTDLLTDWQVAWLVLSLGSERVTPSSYSNLMSEVHIITSLSSLSPVPVSWSAPQIMMTRGSRWQNLHSLKNCHRIKTISEGKIMGHIFKAVSKKHYWRKGNKNDMLLLPSCYQPGENKKASNKTKQTKSPETKKTKNNFFGLTQYLLLLRINKLHLAC